MIRSLRQYQEQLFDAINAGICTRRDGSECSHDDTTITAHAVWRDLLATRRQIFVVGNGGSAGIASHHAVDLLNKIRLRAQALVEPGVLTCMSNDYGYQQSFAGPLAILAQPGDCLVAISSSGKSPNIVEACQTMHRLGGTVITLSGFSQNNPLRQLGTLNCWINATQYGFVEVAHMLLLHSWIDAWNRDEMPDE